MFKVTRCFNVMKEKVSNFLDGNAALKIATVNTAATTSIVVSNYTMLSASALEGGDMSSVTGAFDNVTGVMSSLWTFMIGNPLLCTYMAAGLAFTCLALIRKAKKASR